MPFSYTGEFTCLEVVFRFKRRLGYYLFHTYVPTCLIVIMSWISFWIKPEAVPARVTRGVTSLLTLSTQHANSQKSLPPVSYIKAIDVFMSGCTVFVFLSLMEYALVNIVMGDIADIEKKKSMGISNLILGTRGIHLKRDKDGTIENDVSESIHSLTRVCVCNNGGEGRESTLCKVKDAFAQLVERVPKRVKEGRSSFYASFCPHLVRRLYIGHKGAHYLAAAAIRSHLLNAQLLYVHTP